MNDKAASLGLRRFLAMLKAGDDEAIEGAVFLLTPVDEGPLLARLDTADSEERWWLLRALAHCGSEQALPKVAAALDTEDIDSEDKSLRAVAIMTVGELVQRLPMQSAPYLGQLATQLGDESGMVRQVAADALAQCGNLAIDVLVQVLRFSENQGARSRAAAALSKIRTPAAVGPLYHCLNDQNYLVHTYAHEALDAMGLLENRLIGFS